MACRPSGLVLQDSEAEEHRSDGDAQHRDAVSDELEMKDVLQVEKALVDKGLR